MKTITIGGVGEVELKKSARAKRVILKINTKGRPTVTIPHYVPYVYGEKFARQHAQWFVDHLTSKETALIDEGKKVGRSHSVHIIYKPIQDPSSQVRNRRIIINVPFDMKIEDPKVQTEAAKACRRALKKEAEEFLPGRLYNLARQFGYSYSEVRIKTVYTRWGSCSANKIINLSVWLMQLPDDLITYVLCHELTHLNHLHHQSEFWQELAALLPDYKVRLKALKEYQPQLM